ncbi:MAG: LysR family transcriptional regulator [Marinobacter sp.]|uniref:winged helix-turn-helix domain-containing protein n=1 Tax=Marinobacter sp. TaxID=50741 RepID=UPI00299DE57F|nr:LysR family transcriptional regulator [Marinobacter sp.]MDX1756412.1 LysR family transcriptional regulator [Marinobacter sp.]
MSNLDNKPQLSPRLRLKLGKEIAMGPGKAELLEQIDNTRSISAAAKRMGMSYRRAWLLVDTMNQCFAAPLVDTATGGRRGGGARLSPLGREVLALYRQAEQRLLDSPELTALSQLASSTPPDECH